MAELKAIRITFNESATLKIFTDLNNAGPFGPSYDVKVAAGEIWYAPTSEGNQLMTTASRPIPVENDSFSTFHNLGTISRSTNEQPYFTQIAAVNRGTILPRPQVPLYEAKVVGVESLDTTHLAYLD